MKDLTTTLINSNPETISLNTLSNQMYSNTGTLSVQDSSNYITTNNFSTLSGTNIQHSSMNWDNPPEPTIEGLRADLSQMKMMMAELERKLVDMETGGIKFEKRELKTK
tara:strand:+ start:4141 stop:4467 length:327 start_codon:yes stop_codon:yes gene_type:complete